jgi:hypothetical protein
MVKGKGIVPMVQWYNGGTLCAILAHYKSWLLSLKFIKRRRVPKGVIQRLITLILKINEKEFSVNNKNLAIVHWEMAQGVHLYIRKRTNQKTLPFFPWVLLTIKFWYKTMVVSIWIVVNGKIVVLKM